MKAMTEELSELADRSTSIDRLQRLFTVFLGLAEPLLDEDVDADGEDDDDGNTAAATATNGTNNQTNNKTRRRRRRHRRKHSSYGQALDMYFKLKGSSAKPGITAAPSTSRPATRNHPNPTSDPAPPPPWDTGPYTSTFHLSDIVPTTTTAPATAANATAPPSPSSAFPLRTSSAPTLPAAASAAAAAAAAATAAASNMYVSSPAPSHVSHGTSIGTTVAGGGGGGAGGPGGNYAMQYSLPPPEATEGYDIPFWELFDVQPSLDWLDVDLGGVMGMGGGGGGGEGH